jgi:putative membrane protein insertion efficiency factor
MKSLLLLLLRGYKLLLSPLLGQNCRFYPSCSEYAMQAIVLHGAGRGSLLAGKRLCKCHPWHPGGVDAVPPVSEPQQRGSKKSSDSCLSTALPAATSGTGSSTSLS